MQWGQFLDHDLDHAMESISRETFENGITCGATCDNRPPCFPIKIEEGDPRCCLNAKPGNTKGGSITVPLTSCLTGLD
jgi:hypothetical protein